MKFIVPAVDDFNTVFPENQDTLNQGNDYGTVQGLNIFMLAKLLHPPPVLVEIAHFPVDFLLNGLGLFFRLSAAAGIGFAQVLIFLLINYAIM